ncbi:serine protein kinase [bacterium (Candidatus Blackallbacteria) CG17_big_fil_post_rev_8_21_14_2_50_48_46]|uniref:Serine protein kinase n=1 Tax=bacterium (Candidatus Blackallbacteria) CG17_big_fil_post_rev_8_21_14_2_50_48_46 TaxID=2014261 RepID=A0A2M7G5H7_9BACT|nr:MAG: serine protein kinase [bacterium (Candidatus Blackallbacteria) CG18_big_fil_WC_8_21_14_2_50_49_26]PIW17215.1 MAG: serine protein kinase [bacterium (Candidatus Blackallbacteria) CG17_big_fil_post_rev_8_21_14_2_50_48_46]PIW51006.1 MAG: serine protein kinase [bacterium (Candidatus Blackallbacteria) CG13_big_fil_rev_8_21_14_2_50_49_14]
MGNGSELLSIVKSLQNTEEFKELWWEGSYEEYLDIVSQNPKVARSAFQRVYDMVVSFGFEEYTEYKKKITRWKFFNDPQGQGADAIFGLDIHLMKLVQVLKAAARRYGTEKRVILLHGPVGSSKSTVARLLKKSLEIYSRTPEGAMYTYSWILEDGTEVPSPMHEEPLKLLPEEVRSEVLAKINEKLPDDEQIRILGDLNPLCRYYFAHFMSKYNGDWAQLIKHIKVRRMIVSERDRTGIGTFQPKDEKNQDSTELSGDINYRKIAEYGSDSDPRAFNFDGEFNVANRGIIEFIEVLKLDVAFLYDLLTASQEHKIKPKKFAQTDIDEVILGHTNEPEYRKLQNNEFMEALRDRTIKIDVPYITRLSEEIKVYEKDFNSRKIKDMHIAPHTIEIAAMWAVLSRLEEPKKHQLNLLQKLKLYNGQMVPGFTEDNVKELRKEAIREGMNGISPRYIQDKISNALVKYADEKYINPFMVMNELDAGLKHHSLIVNEDDKKKYKELLAIVKEEYENIVKSEVQRAISADEDAIRNLCGNYIENVKAYTQKEKVKNKYTGNYEQPDENLMRAIEEKIDIPESRKDDFRREIMNYIGALAIEGRTFEYNTNARLQKALELKLFEDRKDSIKLTSLLSNVMDEKAQQQIDIVKERLIKNYGYNEASATDVLNFVASIFARGDVKDR